MGYNEDVHQTEHMFRVYVDGLQGVGAKDRWWATADGPELTSDPTQIWDGGEVDPVLIPGRPTPSDIALTRPFKHSRDVPVVRFLLPKVSMWETWLNFTPTFPNLDEAASTIRAQGLLSRVKYPNLSAGSTTEAKIEITFKIRKIQQT